ncbi:MAG: family 10 glycosylhydrolase [Clostridia bacterium]|nr:family 10 glycosylhydrolase [Clostridia bacterium]
MRKTIAFLLCCLILCGCSTPKSDNEEIIDKNSIIFKGVWFSYYELDAVLDNTTEDKFKRDINLALGKISALGLDTLVVHARANGDAYYNSTLFPKAPSLQNISFDPLEIIVQLANEHSIRVHAWVNPYRISGSKPLEQLAVDNIANRILTDEDTDNDSCIVALDNGVYFDPASSYAKELIANGVAEIVENYDIDGVHFDDYFYPTTEPSFDNDSYLAYFNATTQAKSLADFRRENINALIKTVYETIKNKKSSVEFGISPMYNMEVNFEEYYADAELWLKSEGYVDYICPQLYFGYKHSSADFTKILSEWNNLSKHKSVKLYAGLAPYKIGTDDEFSNNEWNTDTDILKRQVIDVIKSNNFDGYCFYSYTSLFDNSALNLKQRENLLSVIK